MGIILFGKNVFGVAFGIVFFGFFAYAAEAQSIPKEGSGASSPGSVDCTEINIKYLDDPSLTREEKIALMDIALFRSLGKFDECKTSQTNSSIAGSDGLGQNTGGGSVASSEMSGTEEPTTKAQSGNVEENVTNTASLGAAGGVANGNYGPQLNVPQSSDNGKYQRTFSVQIMIAYSKLKFGKQLSTKKTQRLELNSGMNTGSTKESHRSTDCVKQVGKHAIF
jgi:hypothetical protein